MTGAIRSLLLVVWLVGTAAFASSQVPEKSPEQQKPIAGVGFYENSQGTPLVALVDSAKASLDVEIYEMKDTAVRSAFRRALARGVRVRFVVEPEPMGSSCYPFRAPTQSEDDVCSDYRKFMQEVQSAGGSFVAFNKAALCGAGKTQCFQHGKMVVVDQKLVLMSTGNFNPTNLCDLDQSPQKCNRDYTVVTDDPDVIQGVSQIFEKDLLSQKYDVGSVMTPALAQKFTVSPLSLQPLVDFINSAKKSIQVQNQYLNEPTLNQALISAAKRGVDVSVTVASACSFAKPTAYERTRVTNVYTGFDQAGVSSQFFTSKMKVRGLPGYLHAKAIVVDGVRAWVGSVNGSSLSVSSNREFGLFFSNPAWVSSLNEQMAADHENAMGESWQESLNCVRDAVTKKADGE